MSSPINAGGGGYVAGCACVLLLIVLAGAGLAYGLYKLLEFGQRHGVEPGAVIVAVVLLVALYTVFQSRGNRV